MGGNKLIPSFFRTVLLYILVVNIVFCESSAGQANKNGICSMTACEPQVLSNSSIVATYCAENGTHIEGRCCMNVTDGAKHLHVIVGLDLQNCSINSLDKTFQQKMSNEYLQKDLLEILILNDNPLSNTSTSAEHFVNFTSLEFLLLPKDSPCPGGDTAWEYITENETSTICQHEIDMCSRQNFSCPDNSFCRMHSPGEPWCLCKPGYYGYKCLNKGDFPVLAFTIGILGATIGTTLIMWFFNRRKVTKND